MKYGDPVHKVLNLLESENINPGNLLIGQTVDVKVTDARNAEFLRPMIVGEFYPDGSVLLKDELTQETMVLQFQWNTNTNGLLYTGESDFGVKYELEINRDLMSNESITKLTESRKINEASEIDPKLPIGWKRVKDFEMDDSERHYEKPIKNLFAVVDYQGYGDTIYAYVTDDEDPVDTGKSFKTSEFNKAFAYAEKLAKENL